MAKPSKKQKRKKPKKDCCGKKPSKRCKRCPLRAACSS